MTRRRALQPNAQRGEASEALSERADATLAPLLRAFDPSEIETGIVSERNGRVRKGAASSAGDVVDRLGEALLEASLAHLLRSARDRAGLTLAELAERLDVSRGRVHQLERDGANLELGTVGRLASALGYEARIAFVPRDPAMDATLIAPVPMIDDGH